MRYVAARDAVFEWVDNYTQVDGRASEGAASVAFGG
jgi:hypothetical protein